MKIEKNIKKENDSVTARVSSASKHDSSFQLKDNRPDGTQLQQLQASADGSSQVNDLFQLQAIADGFTKQKQSFQRKENNTGIPENLKTGIENLSATSLDDVKVHRNSDKPAQLQAHAYAQGTNIHLGPGQERHLPHEAWHVVQQKQGRVQPTMQMQSNVNINDDIGLEKEADLMGAKALAASQSTSVSLPNPTSDLNQIGQKPIQMQPRVPGITKEQLEEAQHYSVDKKGRISLAKDEHGLPIPSKQSQAFNSVWNDQTHDIDEANAQIAAVGAKLDNRKLRAEQAKKDQEERSSGWNKIKKATYKGSMKALGGVGGAAAGAAAGAPLGPGALGTAVAGGAIGGGLAGTAAGMTWNISEKGTDLVAAGRERELAGPARFMARNGTSSQADAALETGKDAVMGTFSGALSPMIGFAGDAIGAAAGEGGAGVAAEAFSSSAMSATSKGAADLAYDKAAGDDSKTLKQRGVNFVSDVLLGGAIGAADELDATPDASNNAGYGFKNDLHQWDGQGGEAASDLAYGVGGEVVSGAVEQEKSKTITNVIDKLKAVLKAKDKFKERGKWVPTQNPNIVFFSKKYQGKWWYHDKQTKQDISMEWDNDTNDYITRYQNADVPIAGASDGAAGDSVELGDGEWEPTENPKLVRWSKEVEGKWWFYNGEKGVHIAYDSTTQKYDPDDPEFYT